MRKRGENKFSVGAGFTLIESAIALLIIGLLLAPLGILYNNYMKEKKVEQSYENVQRVLTQLELYKNLNEVYPCPAPLKADRDDPASGYGAASADMCSDTPPLANDECDAVTGMCMQTSKRAVPPLIDGRIVVGGVPFKDLQIDEQEAYDQWGGRLMLAMSYAATRVETVSSDSNAIQVENLQNQTMSDTDTGLTYVVVSAGPNGAGAYSQGARLINPCPDNGPESFNCFPGMEDGSAPSIGVYKTSLQRTDFDDILLYFANKIKPTWQRLSQDVEDIRDLSSGNVRLTLNMTADDANLVVSPPMMTSGGDPSSGRGEAVVVRGEYTLDGMGNPTNPDGTTGAVIVPSGTALCSGADCMDIDELVDGSLSCPPDRYAVGISNGSLVCRMLSIDCREIDPDTPVLNGFDINGDPICVPLPKDDCLEEAISIPETCGKTLTLPDATDGYVFLADASNPDYQQDAAGVDFVDIMGNCASSEFVCSNGTWILNSWSGANGRCDVVFPDDPLDGLCLDECILACGGDPGCIDECNDRLECEDPFEGYICVNQRYVCDIEDVIEPIWDGDDTNCPDNDPDNCYWAVETDFDHVVEEFCECEDQDPEDITISCREHYSNPNYGGIGPHPDYIINPPNFGTAGPAIQSVTYPGDDFPDCEAVVGIVDTSGCSCVNPTVDEDNVNVLDGDPLTKRYLTDCPAGQIVDTSVQVDGFTLPAGTKGVLMERVWDADVADCKWGGAVEVGRACICDMTPVVVAETHVCDHQTCESPDSLPRDNPYQDYVWGEDIYERVPDDDTPPCDLGPPVPVSTGRCVPNLYEWQEVSYIGEVPSIPPNKPLLGEACSCDDYQNTQGGTTVSCYSADPDSIHECICR